MPPALFFTSISGLRVGHAQDNQALTGCTVVLCEQGAVGGVDQRGGAPGTRETDLLRPLHLVEKVHAILLSGGSAFGLDAATGVMRYLEERQVGFDTGLVRVPIVPAAILFDLGLGEPGVRPDAAMGYQACQNATSNPPLEGNVGAGTGASVGKILGMGQAMKAGLGAACLPVGGGTLVGALAAVNCLGDILDPTTGKIVAGVRSPGAGDLRLGEPGFFAGTLQVMHSLTNPQALKFARREDSRANTIIAVVATNARLNKEQANLVAQMAHDGIARSVRPAHTMFDGDTIFCLATGQRRADANIVGVFAAEALSQAIMRAALTARSAGGLPGLADLSQKDSLP